MSRREIDREIARSGGAARNPDAPTVVGPRCVDRREGQENQRRNKDRGTNATERVPRHGARDSFRLPCDGIRRLGRSAVPLAARPRQEWVCVDWLSSTLAPRVVSRVPGDPAASAPRAASLSLLVGLPSSSRGREIEKAVSFQA
jgi:hypothetical protein